MKIIAFIFFVFSMNTLFGMASLAQKNINIFNVAKNASPHSLQQIRFITQSQKLRSKTISKIVFMRQPLNKDIKNKTEQLERIDSPQKVEQTIRQIKSCFRLASDISNYNLKADYYIEMYKVYKIARQLGLLDFQFCELAGWQNSNLMTARDFYSEKFSERAKDLVEKNN